MKPHRIILIVFLLNMHFYFNLDAQDLQLPLQGKFSIKTTNIAGLPHDEKVSTEINLENVMLKNSVTQIQQPGLVLLYTEGNMTIPLSYIVDSLRTEPVAKNSAKKCTAWTHLVYISNVDDKRITSIINCTWVFKFKSGIVSSAFYRFKHEIEWTELK